MEKLLTVVVIVLGMVVSLACATPPDAGDAAADASSQVDAGQGDAATEHDAGGTSADWPYYGTPCDSDADCPGGLCGGLYAPQSPSCWKLCATEDDCADHPFQPAGTSGELFCFDLFEGRPTVCVLGSGNLGPCGDGVNGSCLDTEYQLCGIPNGQTAGFCQQVCNPAAPQDPDACRTPLPDPLFCGCPAGDGCSIDLPLGSGVEGDPDGVCAAPLGEGADCGIDYVSGYFRGCTDGLVCDIEDPTDPVGTCAAR